MKYILVLLIMVVFSFAINSLALAETKRLVVEFSNQRVTPLVLFRAFNAGYMTFTFNNKTTHKSVYVIKMNNIGFLRSLKLRAIKAGWKIAGDDFKTRWIGVAFAIGYQNGSDQQVAEVSDKIYLKGLGVVGKVTQCRHLDPAKTKIVCDIEVETYLDQ